MQYPLQAGVATQHVTETRTNENKLSLQANHAPGYGLVPALKLTYYPSHKFLEAVWQRPANSQEYRQSIRFVGLCTAILRAEYILLDFTDMGNPTEEDEKITALFLHKALSNTTLKRSARLISSNQKQTSSYQTVTEKAPALPYKTEVFYKVSEASQWLFNDFEIQPYQLGNGIWIPPTCSLKVLRNLQQSHEACTTALVTDLTPKKDNCITRCKTNFVEIITDEEKSLIILRWLRKVTTRELQYGILKAGRTMVEKKIRFAILNQQRTGVLTLEEQAWLATQSAAFISRSELERLAIVNSIDVIQQMASDNINLRIRKTYSNHLSNYFLDEHDAMYWLFSPLSEL